MSKQLLHERNSHLQEINSLKSELRQVEEQTSSIDTELFNARSELLLLNDLSKQKQLELVDKLIQVKSEQKKFNKANDRLRRFCWNDVYQRFVYPNGKYFRDAGLALANLHRQLGERNLQLVLSHPDLKAHLDSDSLSKEIDKKLMVADSELRRLNNDLCDYGFDNEDLDLEKSALVKEVRDLTIRRQTLLDELEREERLRVAREKSAKFRANRPLLNNNGNARQHQSKARNSPPAKPVYGNYAKPKKTMAYQPPQVGNVQKNRYDSAPRGPSPSPPRSVKRFQSSFRANAYSPDQSDGILHESPQNVNYEQSKRQPGQTRIEDYCVPKTHCGENLKQFKNGATSKALKEGLGRLDQIKRRKRAKTEAKRKSDLSLMMAEEDDLL